MQISGKFCVQIIQTQVIKSGIKMIRYLPTTILR